MISIEKFFHFKSIFGVNDIFQRKEACFSEFC
nr:MAG TPA: hypothetical protein [Caudoviricetes sp.]